MLLNNNDTLRALQSVSFNNVVEVLFTFAEAKMFAAAETTGKALADVQTVIGSIDKKNKLAKAIHGVCTKLVAEPCNGIVPSCWKRRNVTEPVSVRVSPCVQRVSGPTQAVTLSEIHFK